ncbi:MAG: tetratricopeptide repeat protein [Planctomycetes bacterium]|nr:tetratricopeptide repeat protein [Planctomycetota bacterium]
MRKRDFSIYLVLVVLTWIVFFQVRDFDFVNFDDGLYVFENEQVLSGVSWDSLLWTLGETGSKMTGSWHPLTWLSLMLDADLFDDDAGGFHLTSVLFHTANVLLLYALLRQMTGDHWKSGFVAALFAVHPMHVESVAWISERKDVLSTFFGLIALWAYARYAQRPGRKWYLIALAAFVLSLLSKQMLVTLPFVLLLLDYWPLRRIRWSSSSDDDDPVPETATENGGPCCPGQHWSRLLWEKVPFMLLAVLFCLIAVIGQGEAIVPLELFPITKRLNNAVVVYVIYVMKTAAPYDLACFYPHPESIPLWKSAGAVLLLVLTSIAAIAGARKRPYVLVGWLWYLGTLVPVIGLMQIGSQRMADRYTYIPSIGLFVAVSWLVPSLLPAGRVRRRILACFAAVTLVVFTGMAWKQTGHWKNGRSLFEHAVAVTERNDLAHGNLGMALELQGHLDEAIQHYEMALNIEPKYLPAHINLGILFSNQERYDESIQHYQAVVNLDPNHFQAHNNLGSILCDQNRFREAERALRRAVRLYPKSAIAHCNLGFSLIGQGRFDEANQIFLAAARIDPQYAVSDEDLSTRHIQAGEKLAADGKFPEAIAQFRQALIRTPGKASAQYDLALALSESGNREEARELFLQVLVTLPEFSQAHNELGKLLLGQGNRDSAIVHFREAIRLDPDFEEAQENLRRALTE